MVPGAANPQALNRYAYVLNNPLKYTDPSGHWIFEETPDDPVVVWTRPNGGAVRSAAGVTLQFAPTDARPGYDIRGYLEGQGMRFTGAAWTAENYRMVSAAYQKTRKALVGSGYDPSAALGLGQGLTFNKVTTGGSNANTPANTINFRCDNDPFEYEVETAVHEMGHIMDWHARSEGARWGYSNVSGEWPAATGWRRLVYGKEGYWVMTDRELYEAAPTTNAWNNPGEDFADTFTWWVYSQSRGSFSRARLSRPEDLKRRLEALSTALDKFR